MIEPKKAVKVPVELEKAPYYQSTLQLNGVTIVESCTKAHDKKNTMFLENHFLLFVLEGTHHIRFGNTDYTVNKNEMILLKKAIAIESRKQGNPEKDFAYESMMFFLKDEFIVDFIRMASVKSLKTAEMAQVSVRPFGERLLRFLESVKPFFRSPAQINKGLIRIKMLELLYGIANADKNLLLQLIQLKQQVRTDITRIMEENYLNPVSLSDLAYLSGRSLSSFRRDFHAIYRTNPAAWIREKRMAKAKELLKSTTLSVSEICYQTGYENISHFSRLYKSVYGCRPSQER
ncbi:AraC family transcriptional regulator [Sinomicrobium pectinilyticum]|uniref:AraC family transcriptional regulator n=1 Tax=Sinomicrobium pectinilyticum TaxID=1084421 RepID=A0A3N0DHV6_SINP1|nr:AraC family transcriptional regulator [Sinomicrobium pectinilyticum]RNL75274.1 AraC family transcriptional regulator [Sinomicrobium pectinilyticum]